MKKLFILIICILMSYQVFAGVSLVNLTLNSTTKYDLTSNNLTCNFDLNSTATNYNIEWYKNNNSSMNLMLPLKLINNTLIDFSNKNDTITILGSLSLNTSAGHDSKGAYKFNYPNGILVNFSNYVNNSVGTFTVWFEQTEGYENCAYNLPLISSEDINGRYGFDLSIEGCTNQIFFNPFTNDNYGNGYFSNFKPQLNNWYFVAVTWNKTRNNATLYVNGTLFTNVSYDFNSTNWNGTNEFQWITIGKKTSNNDPFEGFIDEVDYYNYELSANEIQDIYLNQTKRVLSEKLFQGNTWMCKVIPYNITTIGNSYSSNQLLINYVPTIENLSLTYSTNLTCNFNLANNGTSSEIVWYKNNASTMILDLPFEGNLTNMNDYSGNGFNATCVIGKCPTFNATGGHDNKGALNFIRTSAGADNYLNLSALNNFDFKNNITFTTYFKVGGCQTPNNGCYLFSKGVFGSAGKIGIIPVYNISAPPRIITQWHTNGTSLQNSYNIDLRNTGWHHIAFRINTTTMALFLDGVLVNDTDCSYSNCSYSNGTAETYLGIQTLASPRNFNGSVSFFRIYNSSLSSEQIMAEYNNASNVKVSQELSTNDVWNCKVIPFTTILDGLIYSSNNVTIVSPQTCNIITNTIFTNTRLVCDIFNVASSIDVTFDNSTLTQNATLLNDKSAIYFVNGGAYV